MEQARWVNGPSSEWLRTNIIPLPIQNHHAKFCPYIFKGSILAKIPHKMAEEQIAGPLLTEELKDTDALIKCTSLLSQLYIRNLADLKNLDPSCKSKSWEKLAQLISFHNREALEPVEIACRDIDAVSQLRHYIELVYGSQLALYAIYRLHVGCRYPGAAANGPPRAPPSRHPGAARRSRGLNTATPGSSPLSMRLGMWSGWVGKTRKLQLRRKALRARIPTGWGGKERRESADGLDPEKGETGNSRLARTKPLPYPPAAEPPARGGNPGQPH